MQFWMKIMTILCWAILQSKVTLKLSKLLRKRKLQRSKSKENLPKRKRSKKKNLYLRNQNLKRNFQGRAHLQMKIFLYVKKMMNHMNPLLNQMLSFLLDNHWEIERRLFMMRRRVKRRKMNSYCRLLLRLMMERRHQERFRILLLRKD